MHIAILGWGSLLWDNRPDFDKQHEAWESDGPWLPLEFSRVSQTRGDALTLVVDEINGCACRVSHARSKRISADDAIADLRCREGTTLANMGFFFADASRSQSRSTQVLSRVKEWASTKKIDVVVWTDLASNFSEKRKQAYSVSAAIAHLQSLSPAGKAAAAEYVWRAPEFIKTSLRSALEKEPWFPPRDKQA